MIQIKLQKHSCLQCGMAAKRTVDTMNVLTRITPSSNPEQFAYDLGGEPVILPSTLFTPRNKNGTINVQCAQGHQWETGMQEVPTTDTVHRLLMDIGVATEETPPNLLKLAQEGSYEQTKAFAEGVLDEMELAVVEPPEIHKLMVLSTSHISKECNELLEELTGEDSARLIGPGCHFDEYEYGFHLILTGEIDPDEEWLDPTLEVAVAYARKHGCTHLRLDRDGPTMKDLPTYSW